MITSPTLHKSQPDATFTAMYGHMLHMLLYHLDHLIENFTAFIVRGPKIDCSNCPIGELHIFYSWTICHKFKLKYTTAKVALGKIVIFQLLSFKSSECHFKKFKMSSLVNATFP